MNNVAMSARVGKPIARGLNHGGRHRHSPGPFLRRSPMSAMRRDKQETFWALQDVSLEVAKERCSGWSAGTEPARARD